MPQLTGENREIETSLGVRIGGAESRRLKTAIEFGSPDCSILARLTQRELWNNILENTIIDQVPAVVGKQRGIIEPLKAELQKLPSLDGCETIYRLEKTYGHFTGVITRRTHLPVINPCLMIRNDLAENDYMRYNDPIFNRMRSIWRAEWMIATPRKGWSELGIQTIADINRVLSENKFHQDVGIPQSFEGPIDHTLVRAHFYRLLRRGEYVATQL